MRLQSINMTPPRPTVSPRFGILRVPFNQGRDEARAVAAQVEMQTKVDAQLGMLGGNNHNVIVQYGGKPALYGDAHETMTVEPRDYRTVAMTLDRAVPGFVLHSNSEPAFNAREYIYTDVTGFKLLVELEDTEAAKRIRAQ